MRAYGWWLALGTAATLAACSDDGPSVGAIRLTLITTGGDPDLDGYVVTIDSAAPLPVAANDTTLISDIPTGAHVAVLDGVAPNCDVNGGATQDVFVRDEPLGLPSRLRASRPVCWSPPPRMASISTRTASRFRWTALRRV